MASGDRIAARACKMFHAAPGIDALQGKQMTRLETELRSVRGQARQQIDEAFCNRESREWHPRAQLLKKLL
jgi:hypothetical protein